MSFVLLITSSVVGFGYILERLQSLPWMFEYRSLIFAAVLLYIPLVIGHRHRNYLVFVETSPRHILRSLKTFLVWVAIIFPPYALGVHLWARFIWGAQAFHVAPLPDLNLILSQVLVIALPEETFFRGYVQTRFQQIFKPRWRLFGAHLGWGWILTSVVFALAHSIIQYQWWHFAIFFPSLLFGFLREKTDGLLAPILCHAFSNLFMAWIVGCYVY